MVEGRGAGGRKPSPLATGPTRAGHLAFLIVRVRGAQLPRVAEALPSNRGVAHRRVAQAPKRDRLLLSDLPEDTEPERLARLARMRWKIELDFRQLKGELGLDHYEGRTWLAGITTPPLSPQRTASSPWAAAPKSPVAGLTLP